MRRIFVKERSFWTKESFASEHGMSSEKAAACIYALMDHGMMVVRSGAEPDEFGESSGSAASFQVVFVGIAVFDDLVVISYPKYFTRKPTDDELRQVFRVLCKSASTKLRDSFEHDEDAMRANAVALMLAIIESYEIYGVYSNFRKELRDNGAGEISWERTISMVQPYIQHGNAIYLDYKTVDSMRDLSDFVTRLHKSVLTECSSFLGSCGLNDFLSLDDVELSDETLEDFGDDELILHRLENERVGQFVTWKQEVIDQLVMYVRGNGFKVGKGEIAALGTTSFQHIWEEACKSAFGDVLKVQLDKLGFELRGEFASLGSEIVLDLVPHPRWRRVANGELIACGEVATLVPDVVAIRDIGCGDLEFCIYDAKYYTPVLGNAVCGVPGVESVAKQFLYQSAYRRFVEEHGFSRVRNTFLVPSDKQVFEKMGTVDFPRVIDTPGLPFSDVVEMWSLPAKDIFESYLKETRLIESDL